MVVVRRSVVAADLGVVMAGAVALLTAAAPAQVVRSDRTFLGQALARVPMVITGRGFEVDARLDGKGPYRFAVRFDEPGDGLIDVALARRLRLLSTRSKRLDAVLVREVRLGPLTLFDLRLRLRPPGKRATPAVLGAAAFADVLVGIDLRARRLTFHRGALDPTAPPLTDHLGWDALTADALTRGVTTLDVARGRMHVARSAPQEGVVLRAGGVAARFDPVLPAEVLVRRTRSGHLLVRPLLDGRQIGWFVFDTGASRTSISNRVAKKLGLVVVGETRTQTQVRDHRAKLWRAASMQLGALTVAPVELAGVDLEGLSRVTGGVAGIIGGDLLRHAVVELDVRGPKLAIHDPALFALLGVDWSSMRLDKGVPVVECKFEGRGGDFMVDTGDPGTVTLFGPTVKRLDLLRERQVAAERHAGVGGSFELLAGLLSSFELGGCEFTSTPAHFSLVSTGVLGSEIGAGSVGTGVLQPFTLMLDYPGQRVAMLERDAYPLEPDQLAVLIANYGPSPSVSVGIADGRLYLRDGEQEHLLIPGAEGRFYLGFGSGRCEFERDAGGRVTHLTLRWAGRPVKRLRRARG